MIEIGPYGSSLIMLYDDLVEILTDEGKHSVQNVQHVVRQVVDRYKQGLEANEKAKTDFLKMRVENWDVQILSPLTEVANAHFDKLLDNVVESEQKEKAQEGFSREELSRQVEELRKKKDKLLQNRARTIFDNDDLDSFFQV